MVASELNNVRPKVSKKINIGGVAAENVAGVIGVRGRAVFIKRDLVADVSQVSSTHEITNFRAREEHAFGGHDISSIARHGGDAGHDQAREVSLVAVWRGQERLKLIFCESEIRKLRAKSDPLGQWG